MYKFERLEVYQLALEYLDLIYALAGRLPRIEEFNLKPQIIKAGTSIVLNIAEGSTGQSDPEQGRFLAMAVRSLLETIACQHVIQRRGYVTREDDLMRQLETRAELLSKKLQAMRKNLTTDH